LYTRGVSSRVIESLVCRAPMTLGVGSLLVIYSSMKVAFFLAFIIRLLAPSIPAGFASFLITGCKD
jgi:hypothetical protein